MRPDRQNKCQGRVTSSRYRGGSSKYIVIETETSVDTSMVVVV